MSPAGRRLDAILFDIGGTLVHEADPGVPVSQLEPRAVDGARDALRALAPDHRLGAVTNTSVMREPDVRALLDPLGLSAPLEVVVTSSEVGAAKPDPRPILRAVDALGVDPRHTLYVGDRETDRDAALRAGCAFAWSTTPPLHAVERHLSRAGSHALAAAARIAPVDETAAAACREHIAQLAVPPGGLGRLAGIAERLAAASRVVPPADPNPVAVCVFVADHGVAADGVTAWPSSVTRMVAAEAASGGAAISVIAEATGATLHIVDVGTVGDDTPVRGIAHRRVRAGTASLAAGPALAGDDALAALDVGAEIAGERVHAGAGCLVLGEIGIGNTTPAACLVGALAGRAAGEVVGRGAGADDDTLARKRQVVGAALRRVAGEHDPVALLAELGGLEIAAMAGFILAAAEQGVPVVLDGVVTQAAAMVAARIAPDAPGFLLAGHLPPEPASPIALDALGLQPILGLDMAVGEGTGGCLAVPIVRAAARVACDMSTIADVTEGVDPRSG